MSDIKFSCSQCGQHISCDEAWSGHQLQCPACQNTLTVPHLQAAAPVAPQPKSLVPQPPPTGRPKLATGATQVARAANPGPAAQKRVMPRPPKTGNPALKYTVMGVLLVGLALAAYNYLPGLLNQVQAVGTTSTSGSGGAAPAGGGIGPMGEVNGAMDVSDALDGNSSKPRAVAPRPRTVPATNSTARTATGSGQPR